jgi:hypothetical protein
LTLALLSLISGVVCGDLRISLLIASEFLKLFLANGVSLIMPSKIKLTKIDQAWLVLFDEFKIIDLKLNLFSLVIVHILVYYFI